MTAHDPVSAKDKNEAKTFTAASRQLLLPLFKISKADVAHPEAGRSALFAFSPGGPLQVRGTQEVGWEEGKAGLGKAGTENLGRGGREQDARIGRPAAPDRKSVV